MPNNLNSLTMRQMKQVSPNTPAAPVRKALATARAASATPAKKPRPASVEHGAQVRVIKALRERGIPGLLFFAVPNGARRSMKEAASKKAEGMLAGVADLVIISSGRVYFVEMKKPKGTQSDAQCAFQRRAMEALAPYFLADDADKAIAWLKQWDLLS